MNLVTSTAASAAGALVLVATADAALSLALETELRTLGCQVVVVSRVVDAIAELHGAEFDVSFVAASLSPRSLLDLLRASCQLSPETENVVILEPGTHDAPVECVRNGAFDFLHQPISPDEVEGVVQRALHRRQLRTSTAMFRASHAILSGTRAADLTKVTVDLAADLLSADGVAFYRRKPDGALELVHDRGVTAGTAAGELIALAETLTRGAPGVDPIVWPEGATDRDLVPAGKIRSALVCPVLTEGMITGVLAAYRTSDPRPFRRGDAERSAVLTSQLRLALENVRLVERTVATERLAAIGELAAGVAHEINNPLTYVLSNCELAYKEAEALGSLGDDLLGMLSDAMDGAERIREIARDLRLLSRRTCRPGEIAPSASIEIFDFSEAVRSALRVATASVREWIDIHAALAPNLRVVGRRGRASQVFVNLLVNAAQAAATCSGPVRVEVATFRRGDRVVATVTDHGPGIPAEHVPRVFDAFFTTKPGDKGTGLGLSITRAIVEEHGGTISVSSRVGAGTTFTIELPAAPLAEAEAVPGQAIPTRASAA